MKSQYFVIVLFITIQGALSQTFNWNPSSKLNSTGPRIVGGITIPITRTPYQVAVISTIGGYDYLCGGTLISPSLVVSAAHCVVADSGSTIPASNIRVYAGFHNMTDAIKTSLATLWVKVHSKYSAKDLRDDIALIKLRSNFTMSNIINVIGVSESKMNEGTNCTISGWGSTAFNGRPSDLLRQAAVPIYNRKKCVDAYKGFKLTLPSGTLCAGFEQGQVDSCQGDSGGPLVCNGVLTGVTSFGYECARAGYPGVYTDVSQYKGWIEKNNSNAVSSTFWLTIVLQIAAYYGLTK